MIRFSHALLTFILATGCLLSAGCRDSGPRTFPVSGKVVFADGSYAQFGDIEFRAESGEHVTARGKINNDGTFRLKSLGNRSGTVAGWHQVVIVQNTGNARGGLPAIHHHHGLDVAAKYRSYDTSDLRFEVKPSGTNVFEILVESW